MASKSRSAQEALTGLEKDSAPFEDQLAVAAKFLSVDLNVIGRFRDCTSEAEEQSGSFTYHGREEWLLRWLLKKLQSPKDEVPRNSALSWKFLSYLLQIIPLPVTARILIERRFVSILRQTLEDIKKSATCANRLDKIAHPESSPEDQNESLKKSKKRKRSGEPVEAESATETSSLYDLLRSILTTIDLIVNSTRLLSIRSDEGRSDKFAAEYMKTVLRTTTEESVKILGTWLTLLKLPDVLNNRDGMQWLPPVIDIWQSHIADENDLLQFSLHCTSPLLALLHQSHNPSMDAQLEQLISRNIMIPARVATLQDVDSDLLAESTKLSILIDSINAAHLFKVAIRSTQPNAVGRRKPQDDTWLQTVFTTLRKSMPDRRGDQNLKAITFMIQSAARHRVILELPVLRSVIKDFGEPDGEVSSEHWELLSSIIKLDANAFLMSSDDMKVQDVLKELLKRITAASNQPSWPQESQRVVKGVLIPLMVEFAKARDLTGFIHHWHSQLVEFERLRKDALLYSLNSFGAWEDVLLQREFSNLLEAFLTTQQITQILDFLETQVGESPGAVCVILEAIAASITREEVVDAVGLRCYDILFNNGVFQTLDNRYKWRSWRIISQTLNWASTQQVEKVLQLWNDRAKPFDTFFGGTSSGGLLELYDSTTGPTSLEILRCACVSWNALDRFHDTKNIAQPALLRCLQGLALDVKSFIRNLQVGSEIGNELCKSDLNTLFRGIGWMNWSFVRCVFVESPNTLTLGPVMKDEFRELLQNVFWIASAGKSDLSSNHQWLHQNNEAFSDLWASALNQDCVVNNPEVIETMIELMLNNDTYADNPLMKSETTNAFAVQSLLKLPLGILHRRYRERILKMWLPKSHDTTKDNHSALSNGYTAVDAAVLALKVKVMQRPMFIEGMIFRDLLNLAESLAESSVRSTDVSLALLKELIRLTIEFIFTNADAIRNKEYLMDAFNYVQKKVKRVHDKSKHRWDYPSVALFETVVKIFNARSAVAEKVGIASKAELKKTTEYFRDSLLIQWQSTLRIVLRRGSSDDSSSLLIISIIDALAALGIDASLLSKLQLAAQSFSELSGGECGFSVKARLDTFLATSGSKPADEDLSNHLVKGDTSDKYGRISIQEKTYAAVAGTDRKGKLELLKSILAPGEAPIALGTLFAARHVIVSIEDERKHPEDEIVEDTEEGSFDLSSAYSILCPQLWRTTSVRQFSLLSETLGLLLRTKSRSISQYNVDSTLGSIALVCSRVGPSLRFQRAGSIYLHLCTLLRTILTSHRLKLNGHFHLLLQTLQALLRCLFTPLPHSNTKKLKHYSPPPWILPSNPLTTNHAVAFTRLVTLICDPSVSSVTRSRHNNLTSSMDKAKRMAGQHMKYVLTTYIKLQLEMKMRPDVREKMIPGLYAIFDTTTPDSRRGISEGLDASGRSVFGVLYRDYARFGKWKGS